MASPGTFVRDFFTRNIGYKLVALLLALLLWFDVATEEITVIEYPVPLRIAVEGRDMIVTNEVPSEVEVRFSGTGSDLLRLDKDDLTMEKQIEGGENDTTLVSLEPQDLQRPADLNVTPVSVTPGRIVIVTDRFVEKTVPLEPIGAPQAERGYQLLDVTVEPRRVKVRGVTAEVNPIGSLGLDLSQLEPVAGTFDQYLEIAVPESLRTVTVTPDSVRITGRAVRVEAIEDPADAED